MSKRVVLAHTIEQWFALDSTTQSIILENIRLKDRLHKWLENRPPKSTQEVQKVVCVHCEGTGEVDIEPRFPGIHPSQVVHPCLLKIWYEMKEMPTREKIKARQQLIFDLGTAIHRMFQSYGLQGAWGKEYHPEVAINGDLQEIAYDLMLEGHADADNILVLDGPELPCIYEVGIVHEYKSIKSKNFEKLTRPKPEHRTQAMIYARAMNRPIVGYMYLNKDDSNILDFPVPFDWNTWNSIESKARLLVNYYLKNEQPPGDSGYHCTECQYNHICSTYASTRRRGS